MREQERKQLLDQYGNAITSTYAELVKPAFEHTDGQGNVTATKEVVIHSDTPIEDDLDFPYSLAPTEDMQHAIVNAVTGHVIYCSTEDAAKFQVHYKQHARPGMNSIAAIANATVFGLPPGFVDEAKPLDLEQLTLLIKQRAKEARRHNDKWRRYRGMKMIPNVNLPSKPAQAGKFNQRIEQTMIEARKARKQKRRKVG